MPARYQLRPLSGTSNAFLFRWRNTRATQTCPDLSWGLADRKAGDLPAFLQGSDYAGVSGACLSFPNSAEEQVRSALFLLPVASVIIVACAPPMPGPRTASDSQVITEEEIDASNAGNAFEVIRKLRANFLTYRGETSLTVSRSTPYPTVYLDGREFGPIESLRTIPASQISLIRLFRSWEATTRYGTGNLGGVIAISTRQ